MGALAKQLRKVTIRLVTYVRPSSRLHETARLPWDVIREILYLGFVLKYDNASRF